MKQNILITGYPGFLGNYILKYFDDNNYNVYSLGLLESDRLNHIISDISGEIPNLPDIEFDIVIHAAGKAHVIPKTEAEKKLFYKVNFDGTKNLVKALSKLSKSPKSFVFISTVAVYGVETGELLDEDTSLNPTTPYGESKKQAENFINSWETETKKNIVRLPLLVGENPPGNLGKMIHAVKKAYYFNIAGGNARRSMVLAEDFARFIPVLAQHEGIFNLTDGSHPSFYELSKTVSEILNKRPPKNIPLGIAKLMAKSSDILQKIIGRRLPFNSYFLNKMTNDLTFSDSKAKRELGWNSKNVIDELSSIIGEGINEY